MITAMTRWTTHCLTCDDSPACTVAMSNVFGSTVRTPEQAVAVAQLLELQFIVIRYRRRMAQSHRLDVAAPNAVQALLREDLARRANVTPLDISNTVLEQHLATYGVQAQWEHDPAGALWFSFRDVDGWHQFEIRRTG